MISAMKPADQDKPAQKQDAENGPGLAADTAKDSRIEIRRPMYSSETA
jgi:hypothetical protein